MEHPQSSESRMVTALIPSLSRSLAEQFNVFRVMHHGTHEKQLSNVFAWLLRDDGTHELGDAFQKIFMNRVNGSLPERNKFGVSGYRVAQEVDTAMGADSGKDIADIVLMSPTESVVIENYHTSDGHGHSYQRYLAYGAQDGRDSVVVLLCLRRESGRQTDGWHDAIVLTYAELLSDLRTYIKADKKWRRNFPQQNFFINELVENFVEGPHAVSIADQIAFIQAMCETGESVRYGHRPQETAAEQFAEIIAQHAKRQFEDGRKVLQQVKRNLREYAQGTLQYQINEKLGQEIIASVRANFVGQWEWYVRLLDADHNEVAALLFGPTAAIYHEETLVQAQAMAENERPDFSKIFILMSSEEAGSPMSIHPTNIGMDEVIAGFAPEDDRLAHSLAELLQGKLGARN